MILVPLLDHTNALGTHHTCTVEKASYEEGRGNSFWAGRRREEGEDEEEERKEEEGRDTRKSFCAQALAKRAHGSRRKKGKERRRKQKQLTTARMTGTT
jgi:hypothetical protein